MYAYPFLWATLYTSYLNVWRKALQQRSFWEMLRYRHPAIWLLYYHYHHLRAFSIFGLVNLRTSEPFTFSDLWTFGLMNLFYFSDFWTFGPVSFRTYELFCNFRTSEPSDQWSFGLMNLRTNDTLWNGQFFTFGLLNLRTSELSDLWTFGLVGGHRLPHQKPYTGTAYYRISTGSKIYG